jgi:hypothetical protein
MAASFPGCVKLLRRIAFGDTRSTVCFVSGLGAGSVIEQPTLSVEWQAVSRQLSAFSKTGCRQPADALELMAES